MNPLFQATVDGSLSRRFGLFVMIAAIVLITVMMLRLGSPGGRGHRWARLFRSPGQDAAGSNRLSTEP